MMIHKKIEVRLMLEEELVQFKYNPFYITKKGNSIRNRTNEKRYLVLKSILINKKYFRRMGAPKGIQVIVMNEKTKIRADLQTNFNVRGSFSILIQMDPFSEFDIKLIENLLVGQNNQQDEMNNENISNKVLEKLSDRYVYLESKHLHKLINKDRYEFLKTEISVPNSFFYIGDDFTRVSLENTVHIINLELMDIFLLDDLLREEHFNLNIKALFLESAWLGKNNSWRQIVSKKSFEMEYLVSILKKYEIKIIFFNKEDPLHFHSFKHNANFADLIMTTSEEMVGEYKDFLKNHPGKHIIASTYFINEVEYNYFKAKNDEEKTLFFAGSYYPKFKERTNFIDENISYFADKFDFKIYDRMKGCLNTENKFPPVYSKYIVSGALGSEQLLKATESYLYSLNLSSIVDSQTMIARRIYEMIALGKIQISNYSDSLDKVKKYPIIYSATNDIIEIDTLVNKSKEMYPPSVRLAASMDVLNESSAYSLFQKMSDYVDLDLDIDLNVETSVSSLKEFEAVIELILKQRKHHGIRLLVSCSSELFCEIKKHDYAKMTKEMVRLETIDYNQFTGAYIKIQNDMNYHSNYFLTLMLLLRMQKNDSDIKGVSIKKLENNQLYNFDITEPQMYKDIANVMEKKCKTIILHSSEEHIKKYKEEIIIMSGVYPTKTDIYRNGFVHTRAKEYQELGYDVHIIVPSEMNELYVFEGITVQKIDKEKFYDIFMEKDKKTKIVIHALTALIYSYIKEIEDKLDITIWIHGAEALAAERREDLFIGNNATAQYEHYKKVISVLKGIWGEILLTNKYRFVFVSQWMKDIFDMDMNTGALEYKYDIIPNPIKTDFYNTADTDFSSLKFLSIRPFASRKYANDITVETIMQLSEKPYFDQLEFTIIGDGIHWDEVLKPLLDANFPNVTLVRKFLNTEQIKAYHKKNNIFFAPTRQDSQGVSMCEAMSSGLIIFSSNNTAIPEFIPEGCGVLINNEDTSEYIEKIEAFLLNPKNAEEISEKGREFIRSKTDSNNIIRKELEYILGDE